MNALTCRTLGYALLLAPLFAGSGCLHALHPVKPMNPEVVDCCYTMPPEAREHVYVFILNGFDVWQYGNMVGVAEYIRDLGFPNTYYGQMYHTSRFMAHMERINMEDPQARFVLIGFSLGAPLVFDMGHAARDMGIPIDSIIFVAGKGVKELKDPDPENPIRIIDIISLNVFWKGEYKDQAERVHEPGVIHFKTPTDYRTMDTIIRELADVASRVVFDSGKVTEVDEEDELTSLLQPTSLLGSSEVRQELMESEAEIIE